MCVHVCVSVYIRMSGYIGIAMHAFYMCAVKSNILILLYSSI